MLPGKDDVLMKWKVSCEILAFRGQEELVDVLLYPASERESIQRPSKEFGRSRVQEDRNGEVEMATWAKPNSEISDVSLEQIGSLLCSIHIAQRFCQLF